MEINRVDKVKCSKPIVFFIIWILIFLWMLLSICNDWGNGLDQSLLDLIGLICFDAIMLTMILSFGSASGIKKFMCDIYDGIDKNIKKILLYEVLIILLMLFIMTIHLIPFGKCLHIYFTHDYRTAWIIVAATFLVFIVALICYIAFLAKKISKLIMEKYSGRIIRLGTILVLMANLYVMVLLDNNDFNNLLVVICVFYFLNITRKIVWPSDYKVKNLFRKVCERMIVWK